LSNVFSVLALAVWVSAVSLLAVYVFVWGGDVQIAELHNRRRSGFLTVTPRRVRLLVGALYLLFVLITGIKLFL